MQRTTLTDSTSGRRDWVPPFIAVCLVAINMRITLTGVGPLLSEIASSEHIRIAQLGALGSIPLLVWAAVSPFAHSVGARLGMSRAIKVALLALSLGTVWRSLPGSWVNLWAGTVLIAGALAIANVLMPAIIKRSFAGRMALVMGVYSALQGIAGAPASGLAVPLSALPVGDGTLGWRVTLLLSGFLIPLATLAWLYANRRSRGSRSDRPWQEPALSTERHSLPRSNASTRIWRDPLAWQIAVYAGAQSTVFYTLLTWLASYETSAGRTATLAGIDLMLMQLFGVLGSAALPWLSHGRARKWVPAVIPLVMASACAGIALAPEHMLIWSAVAGFTMGSSFTVSLTLMAERARDHRVASALSGMAQSVGYVLAAAGPISFGWLHSVSGDWQFSFGFLLAVTMAQLVVGVLLSRERYVLDNS